MGWANHSVNDAGLRSIKTKDKKNDDMGWTNHSVNEGKEFALQCFLKINEIMKGNKATTLV